MTVQEIIEKLQKCDPNATVAFFGEEILEVEVVIQEISAGENRVFLLGPDDPDFGDYG